MTELDPMRARAEALHLHGLLAHWPEVAAEAWVAPLLGWEEQERPSVALPSAFQATGTFGLLRPPQPGAPAGFRPHRTFQAAVRL